MMKDLYIVGNKKLIYMENTKIRWIYNFKDHEDRKNSLRHLKESSARISMAS